MDELVLTRVEDGVLVVTMNRPEARNAMSKAMAEALSAAWDRLDADAALSCAVLAGGGGTFCSGMDLKGFLAGELPVVPGRGFGALTEWTPKKPVIAAVDGHAVAGGMELAIACDLIVANRGARFGIPEAKRGMVAGGGGMVRLPRLMPRALVMEMALTGEPIPAERAHAVGLVSALSDGPALDAALVLARKIAACAPLATQASKAVIRDSWLWPEEETNARQGPYIRPVFESEDAREGARAFAEKRAPVWQGR